jgi:hypothetical protein
MNSMEPEKAVRGFHARHMTSYGMQRVAGIDFRSGNMDREMLK